MTKILWKIEKRKVKELLPASYNPRKLSEQERRDLEESIKEFGAVIPVVINIGKRDNTIIGGHQRTTIYADLAIEEIDVMVPDRELTKAEEKKLNLRLNKNTGSWDFEKLKEIDMELLLDVGFGDEDLQALFDDVDVIDDEFSVAKAVSETKKAKVKLGEVWQLGDHRLMCGDSMDTDQVKKLMGGVLADMVYCDPPYNIGLDYSKGFQAYEKDRNDREYGGKYSSKKDSKKAGDYVEFIRKTLSNALASAKPNAHVFYWCDENWIWVMQQLYQDAGLVLKRVCLWIKNNMALKPQTAFNKVYEPCVYATRGTPYLNRGMTKLNEIMNKEVETGNQVHDEIYEMISIWLDKRDQNYEHPTQKPITLAEKPIKRCTAPGHVILDLFGGSGSTMIAAQQVGRRAFLMEQDPIFCTVILDRWEKFTNLKAKKA